MPVTLLSVSLGVALVGAIAWDIALTLLHASAKGPLGHRGNRLAWRLVRFAADRSRRRLLSWTGPAAMATNFIIWLGGMWLGFALIYLPFVETFSYAPSVGFGDPVALDALYMSGVAMTTVGFGDVVASTDALRLVTVAESASGFAVFTAAITYVLSVYPLVGDLRTSAVQASDLGLLDLEGTAQLIGERDVAPIAALHRRIVENHQTVRRFPVLYYFSADDPSESVVALFRAAINACLVLCWDLGREQVPRADAYCAGLRATLDRVIDDYELELLGGPSVGSEPHCKDGRLRAVREILAATDTPARQSPEDDEDFRRFVQRSERFLDRLADAYGYERHPLV